MWINDDEIINKRPKCIGSEKERERDKKKRDTHAQARSKGQIVQLEHGNDFPGEPHPGGVGPGVEHTTNQADEEVHLRRKKRANLDKRWEKNADSMVQNSCSSQHNLLVSLTAYIPPQIFFMGQASVRFSFRGCHEVPKMKN